MKKEEKFLSFSSFLKREFPLNQDLSISLPQEEKRTEAAYKKLKNRLGRVDAPRLAEVLEERVGNIEMSDIDEKIEAEWQDVFHRIRKELLEADSALMDGPIGKSKKSRRLNKSFQSIFSGTEYSHLQDSDLSAHNWFVKFAVTVTVAVVFSLSIGVMTPGLADSILGSVERVARFSVSGVTRSVDASMDSYESKKAYRVKLDDKAKSDFINNNQGRLKTDSRSRIQVTPSEVGELEVLPSVEQENQTSIGEHLRDFISGLVK